MVKKQNACQLKYMSLENSGVWAQSKTKTGRIFWSATFMSKAKILLWFFINYQTWILLQLFSEKKIEFVEYASSY